MVGLAVMAAIGIALVLANPFSPLRDTARSDAWKRMARWRRVLKFPLHFAITPVGRYSLSLLQVFWWSLIVAFAFAYVYSSRGSIFKPTPQVLTLLGIAVGSALSAIAIAASKVPNLDRFLPPPVQGDNRTASVRLPQLRDLFSDGGRLSVFKFQVFVFTALIGGTALAEVWQTGTFPAFEPEVLALMGISNTAYVASELGSDQQLKDIRDLTRQIDEGRVLRDRLSGDITALTTRIALLTTQIDALSNTDPRVAELTETRSTVTTEKARLEAALQAQSTKITDLQTALAVKVNDTLGE